MYVVIITKKDGTISFWMDNQGTERDAYPIPLIDGTLLSLSGSKYFTTLDLKSGYWQVELD